VHGIKGSIGCLRNWHYSVACPSSSRPRKIALDRAAIEPADVLEALNPTGKRLRHSAAQPKNARATRKSKRKPTRLAAIS
jgi:hypothetical protein